ncbi:hypothetical protein WMF37_30540 [Sorangium sp. So ce291]|uniref:hypothetical protein n=1 Tax=Sorangium sp. So ce291 TaxID=3133294 RepID=UPI003F60D75D
MPPSTPPVPWSPPTWLTSDRIVLAAVVPFAAAAALPAVWWIPRARDAIQGKAGAAAVMATSTALLSVALIRYALRATPTAARGCGAFWAAPLPACSTPACRSRA